MMPVRKLAVLGLLEWLRINKPSVRSLCGLDRETFMAFATEYELAKGVHVILDPKSELRKKWESAHIWFGGASSDQEALADYPE
jgi:hypothetical protein